MADQAAPDNTKSAVPSTAGEDQRVSKALASLRRMLDYRRQYDQRRALFYRQYVGQRDAVKFPDNLTNRANTFVPYPLSNVETITSRTMDAFFSFDPWFEVSGLTSMDDTAADAMQLVLAKKLKEAKVVEAVESVIRTIAIYGHGGIKVDWNWDYKTLTKPVPVPATDPQTQQPIINPATGQPIIVGYKPQTFKVPMACPKITPIDVYDLMCDPDGGIVAQLTEQTFVEMKRSAEAYKEATGNDMFYPDALAQLENVIMTKYPEFADEIIIRYAELWNVYDGTCTVVTFGDDADALSWKDLRASYRAVAYSPYKRRVYTGPAALLWHGENQFAHKRNPILHTSYIKLPNELYGMGAIEITSDLTEALNKFTNMITDNWNLGINRRFAYDENADIDHTALKQFNVPGGLVPVNGVPKDVIEPLPLFTPNQGDYAILDLYKGMVEMASGISDFYGKGVGSPTGNRTATGINSVINESNFRFKMFIRNLELDILQPLLAMCASMIQQFMSDAEEVQITKTPGPQIPKWTVVSPADLIGNFEFNLVAANYATNKVVRQRNLMAFANIAQQTPYWRAGEGLREIGKVLEIRNINELIKSDEEVAQEQQAAQEQQMRMLLLEKVVDTESQLEVARQAGAVKAAAASGKSVPSPRHSAATGRKEGRPAKAQFEGAIPGAGSSSPIRDLGQNLGANALGLSGLGDMGQE